MPTIDRDGSAVFYETLGSGDPPIVFLHGMGMHDHYGPQIEHFSREHRVVAPDLPGYGRSDAPQREYSIQAFASDVARLCDELTIRDAVIVGHSMAGGVALEVAVERPDLVLALVLIDPVPIVAPPTFRTVMTPFVEALKSPAYREALRGYAEARMFRPTDDPDIRARVIDEMTAQPQHVLAGNMASVLAWEGEKVARQVQVPVLMITNGDGIPADIPRIREILPQLEHGRTVGVGHFGHLIDPGQVNAMIERFLFVLARPATAQAAPA